jgi:ribosomal protein S18 acetylase RimI-like enzyme
MLVRDVRWSDFEDLKAIYYHLYDERAAGEPIGIHLFGERPTEGDEVDWFARTFRGALEGQSITVVAEVDGRPVGACTIGRKGPRPDSEIGHVGILGILIDHRYRGRGIGRALMVAAIEKARGMFEIIQLSLFADNHRARALYRKLGFVPFGVLPAGHKRSGKYIDEEYMFLDLRANPPPAAAPNR